MSQFLPSDDINVENLKKGSSKYGSAPRENVADKASKGSVATKVVDKKVAINRTKDQVKQAEAQLSDAIAMKDADMIAAKRSEIAAANVSLRTLGEELKALEVELGNAVDDKMCPNCDHPMRANGGMGYYDCSSECARNGFTNKLPVKENEDSANLGFQQTEKTTTADREKDNHEGTENPERVHDSECMKCSHGRDKHPDGGDCTECDCAGYTKENADPKVEEEAAEIARHAEGIEHEVKELVENAGEYTWYRVKLHGKVIDKVSFRGDLSCDTVKRSLVDHDNYDPAIEVTVDLSKNAVENAYTCVKCSKDLTDEQMEQAVAAGQPLCSNCMNCMNNDSDNHKGPVAPWAAPENENGMNAEMTEAYSAGLADAKAGKQMDMSRAKGYDAAYKQGYQHGSSKENAAQMCSCGHGRTQHGTKGEADDGYCMASNCTCQAYDGPKGLKNMPDGTFTEPEKMEKVNDVAPGRSLLREGVAAGNEKYGKAMKNEVAFGRGSRVRSRVDAQGMKKGEEGEVVDVNEKLTFAGNFVTYQVKLDSGKVVSVGNGHMVLDRA